MLLGAAGLLPALSTCAVVFAGPPTWRDVAALAAAGYAAIIVSFIGGAWWGLAAAAPRPRWQTLALSIVPSLAGWAALLLDRPTGLVMLGLLLVAVLPGDQWLVRTGVAPAWWMQLRWPLSLGLGTTTLATGFALAA